MKVLALTHEPWSASTRYRVLQYVPHLERAGAEVAVEPIPRNWYDRWKLFGRARDFDVVLLQKRLVMGWQVRRLRRCAKRLVYDFDDAIPFRSPERGGARSWTRHRRFRATVRAADVVLAGNAYLKELAEPDARQALVIPTALDPAKYDRAAARAKREVEIVTLGWIGSRSTLRYVESLGPLLERVAAARPKTRLKLVCDAFFDVPGMTVEKKPWSDAGEAEDAASFDVGLAPTGEDAWSLGKCGLKVLQYLAASRPVVCTPAGVHREMVRDGVNGYWARTEAEWSERLIALIDSAEDRKRMGREGRRILEERYTVAANAPAFVRAVLGRDG